MRGFSTGNKARNRGRGRNGAHAMPRTRTGRHAWNDPAPASGEAAPRRDAAPPGPTLASPRRARPARPVGVAANLAITAAFVVAGAPGFTPTGQSSADGGVVAAGSADPTAPPAHRPDIGLRSTGSGGDASAVPVDPAPVERLTGTSSYSGAGYGPEAAAPPPVISELGEFYSEYAAAQADREQKLGRQSMTVPQAPAPGPYPAPEPDFTDPAPAAAEPAGAPTVPQPVDPPGMAAAAPDSAPAADSGPGETITDQPTPNAPGPPREIG